MADEALDTSSAEVVTEEPEIPAEETPEDEQPTPEEIAELRKQAKKADDQEKRAIKAEAELKKLKPENKRAPNTDADDDRYSTLQADLAKTQDRAVRAELRSIGITHPDDLKVVLEAAKELGIDPTDAAERRYVKAQIEEQREERRTQEATPGSKNRGGSAGSNNVSSLADKVEKGGPLPADPDLKFKVQEELRKRSRSRA